MSGSTPGTTSKKLRKRTDTADGVLKSEQSMSEELVLLNSEHNDTDDDDGGGGGVRGLCHKMIENSGDCGLDLKTNKMAMGQPGGTGVELGETGGADSDQVLKTGKQYHVACCVQSFDDAVNERQRTDVSIGDRGMLRSCADSLMVCNDDESNYLLSFNFQIFCNRVYCCVKVAVPNRFLRFQLQPGLRWSLPSLVC